MSRVLPVLFWLMAGCLLCVQPECKAQEKLAHKVALKDLQFEKSIFASCASDSSNTYCLLGKGFFRCPAAPYADSMIDAWIKRHPAALVIPVSTMWEVTTDNTNSRLTYCWLVDKRDTINNYLIRNGCFPGATMVRPETRSELTKAERDTFGADYRVDVFIDPAGYVKFLSQIKGAEQQARDARLGVWQDKPEE